MVSGIFIGKIKFFHAGIKIFNTLVAEKSNKKNNTGA